MTTEPQCVPHRWRLIARDFGDLRVRRRHANGGAVVGVLIWNDEEGEGEVLLHPSWMGNEITELDAVSDWSGLLHQEYEARVNSAFPQEEVVLSALGHEASNQK